MSEVSLTVSKKKVIPGCVDCFILVSGKGRCVTIPRVAQMGQMFINNISLVQRGNKVNKRYWSIHFPFLGDTAGGKTQIDLWEKSSDERVTISPCCWSGLQEWGFLLYWMDYEAIPWILSTIKYVNLEDFRGYTKCPCYICYIGKTCDYIYVNEYFWSYKFSKHNNGVFFQPELCFFTHCKQCRLCWSNCSSWDFVFGKISAGILF